MHLLARGTRVIGGASLGALRAVELERFGMAGIGGIFHAYRSGAMVRDDAVMLVHAPAELGYARCRFRWSTPNMRSRSRRCPRAC